jgi:hypothetical protein
MKGFKMKKDCDTCGRPKTCQVCPMLKTNIDTCLKNPSRPFWKSQHPEAALSPEHLTACRIIEQESQEPSQQDLMRAWIAKSKVNQTDSDSGPQYTSDSAVSKRTPRIDELVSAHWSYQEKLLSVGQDKTQIFTWDQVMEMRKWDYCSSAKHFYGHGYEDAINDALNVDSA